MRLFIRVVNGIAFEHPIFEDNFIEAFPDVDIDNLPQEFARFIRVDRPIIKPYQVYEGVSYEKQGDVFTDVHHVREMTPEEKTNKQNEARRIWLEIGGDPRAIFNEETCWFDPIKTPVQVLP